MWRRVLSPATAASLSRTLHCRCSPFSTAPAAAATPALATSVADFLTKLSSTSTSIADHFDLHFSDVQFTEALLRSALSLSPQSGRAAADLFRHIVSSSRFHPSDSSLAAVVAHLGRRRDFSAALSLISDFFPSVGPDSLSALFESLAAAKRPTQAVNFFSSLPSSRRTRAVFVSLVSSLCDHGCPSHAERALKANAHEFFPDVSVCTTLIKGYASANKLGDTLRLLEEMTNGGFELGTPAYNAVLDCLCRTARKKDPLSMMGEADKFLIEMERLGVPRDNETFRVLIYNLCKIRKTEDAMKLFRRIGEWGCTPDGETYLALVRSLYQAARISEGDQMMEWMRAAGFKDLLDRKAYYGFIKILCGIERVEHAVKVLRIMKGHGHAPGVKIYSLLIEKLARHNLGDRANALFKEAVARGLPVTSEVYKVDKKYDKVKVKNVNKRLTLPEKMEKKRKRLRKLRMSFVMTPKQRLRRRAARISRM